METITVAQIHASIAHQFGRTPTRRASTLAQAQDGWVHAGLERGVREDTWARVCALMGRPELADDPKFNTREARREHQQELLTLINEWTATRPKEEIYHTLQGLRTVAGYVATVADLYTSQQLLARAFFSVLTIRTLVQQPILAHPLRSKAPPGTMLGRRAWVSTMWRCTATASVTPERTWRTCVVPVSSKEQGESMTQFALEGLRILDLTQVAVGPYALLLGFMGAEVIKVESCSRMDISRGAARPTSQGEGLYPGGEPGERPWNRTAHYVHRNGNKRSLTLDLATARGKALLLQLATISDVLIENFRASVMDRLGLGLRPWRTPTPD